MYKIIKQIIKFRDDRNWKQYHKPKDMILSLVLEASELLECYQWKEEADIEKVKEELADVYYWVLLIAHDMKINLTEALRKKMLMNEKKYPIFKNNN